MNSSGNQSTPRKLGRTDAKRGAVSVAILALVFVVWYFLLPLIQGAIVPSLPGGTTGPWVIRPILAFRFGASAIASVASVAFLTQRLRNRWKAEDAAIGTHYEPYSGFAGKAAYTIKGVLLMIIYAGSMLFYLLSWDIVGPAGIELHHPWGQRKYSFNEVESIETIANGMRSDKLAQNGPWYSVKFSDGYHFTFSKDNERCSEAELSDMATFIAAQSHRMLTPRDDSRTR